MMDKCLPALIASALFFSLIVWDINSREYHRIPGYFLFGLFIILSFLVLCSKGLEYVGWVIITLPVILIAAGYLSKNITLPTPKKASTGCIKLAPLPPPPPPSPLHISNTNVCCKKVVKQC